MNKDKQMFVNEQVETAKFSAAMWFMKATALLFAAVVALPAHAEPVVEYIHTDALGTPIAVTDVNGNVVERFEYEPYGLQVSGPVADGPGYTGHVEDTATGFTYMQQRYYDPGIGMFLSVDPVTAYEQPVGQFNRYRYANGNPYLYTDPDGREVAGIRLDSDVAAVSSGKMSKSEYMENLSARGKGALVGVGLVTGGGAFAIAAARTLTFGLVGSESTMLTLGTAASAQTLLTEGAEMISEITMTGEIDMTGSDVLDVGLALVPGGGEAGVVVSTVLSTASSLVEFVQSVPQKSDGDAGLVEECVPDEVVQ